MIRMILVYLLLSEVASADAQPVGAQADVLFREGRNLMADGKIPEACVAFEQSQKLDPAVTTLINLAACRERLGQLATAWELLREAERQAQSANDEAATQLHIIALERAAKLELRVSRLTIRVPDQSKFNQLEILCNEEHVPDEKWNRARPVDGGVYKIVARAPGMKEWSTLVTLKSTTDTQTVDIPNLRDIDPKPIISRNATRRRWAAWKPWTVVSSGGMIMIVGGLLHGLAYRNFKRTDEEFQQLPCGSFGMCLLDQIPIGIKEKWILARREQTIAVGSYIAGGSLIAAGIGLLYMNRPRYAGRKSLAVAPSVARDMLGIIVTINP